MKKTQLLTALLAVAMLTGCAGNAATSSTASTETTAATTAAGTETTTAAETTAEAAAETTAAAPATTKAATAAQTAEETKAETTAAAEETTAEAEDGQNPIMNFIGPYSNGRGMMNVSADGMDGAAIHVSWGGSAAESSTWDMSGTVVINGDELTLNYSNCVKVSTVFAEDGSTSEEKEEYTDGSGVIHFNADNTITWEDHEENIADGSVFEFAG